MSTEKYRSKKVYVPREKVSEIQSLLLDTRLKRAYLDIETDENFCPTVVGIYVREIGFKSLVRPRIKADVLHGFFEKVDVVVTYNGEKFDLEVLRKKSGLVLPQNVQSLDLMYMCWELDLYGGLKKVEKTLGIIRDESVEGMNGYDAVKLWYEYESGDSKALSLLRLYNYYDVMNLVELENRLRKMILEEKERQGVQPNLFEACEK